MYLVAIKSLYRQIGEGNISILNDGSLDNECVEILNRHLGAPEIVDIAEVSTGGCPRGGCWERLLHLLDLAEHSFVIQIDSDVIARCPVPEILQCYKDNCSFTLGTAMGRDFTTLSEAAAFARTIDNTHIQVVAEQHLDGLQQGPEKRYVRGCAGFAGFAHRAASRKQAEDFSHSMQALIGDQWLDWGSEQVTSNYLIANSPISRILPMPSYSNFNPSTPIDESRVLHFLGTTRYYRHRYMRESRRIVAEMNAQGSVGRLARAR